MRQPFTSLRHPVAIDRGLGRWAEELDYARHVEQLIRQVLLTAPGERINRPDFGCGVRRMLFAPNSEVTASLAQASVHEALSRWLGSVLAVAEVKVEVRDEVLEIRIAYALQARQERRYLNLQVSI
jgi:phage baseplate assembly protein W